MVTTLGTSLWHWRYQFVTFSGATTFPTGTNTYTIEGQIGAQTGINGATIVASTNPSSDWTNITGVTTGNNISPGVTDLLDEYDDG